MLDLFWGVPSWENNQRQGSHYNPFDDDDDDFCFFILKKPINCLINHYVRPSPNILTWPNKQINKNTALNINLICSERRVLRGKSYLLRNKFFHRK